jgi:anti-sigma regulatory factor (Ser/Thr protein kinase)
LSRKQAALYQQAVEDLARQLETADGIKRRGMMLAFLMRTSMWELLVQSSFDGR